MFICKNKEDVAALYVQSNHPLSAQMLSSIAETEAELKAEGTDISFAVIIGQCRICNHRQVSICPAVCDNMDDLECGNCGNMTMQERETPEWEQ